MFGIGITWIYVHIGVLDDSILEFEEFFHGVLTTSDPAVILDPDEATVVIQDDTIGMSLLSDDVVHSTLICIMFK